MNCIFIVHKKINKLKILQKWLEEKLRMTASYPANFDQSAVSTPKLDRNLHPAKKQRFDCNDPTEDAINCCKFMQQHKCSKYCLRKCKYDKKQNQTKN